MKENDFMACAINEAKKAYDNGEVPVGAVIVKNNEVIASSYNKKESLGCAVSHAEINAIIEASRKLGNWRLNGCILYVTLEPCPMCASAIKQSRITKIVYAIENSNAENRKIADLIFSSMDSNIPVEKVKFEYNLEDFHLLNSFFKEKRK